jgi:hypothetical protein
MTIHKFNADGDKHLDIEEVNENENADDTCGLLEIRD